jgi:hypothetical protein
MFGCRSVISRLPGQGSGELQNFIYIGQIQPKTLYTLLVLGENSLHIGASRLLLMPWLRVQNAQA